MNHKSDFSPEISEYMYQQIEELKEYVSKDAEFLLEENDEEENRVLLKVKDQGTLFEVDSKGDDLFDATLGAKLRMIQLISDRTDLDPVLEIEKEHRIN